MVFFSQKMILHKERALEMLLGFNYKWRKVVRRWERDGFGLVLLTQNTHTHTHKDRTKHLKLIGTPPSNTCVYPFYRSQLSLHINLFICPLSTLIDKPLFSIMHYFTLFFFSSSSSLCLMPFLICLIVLQLTCHIFHPKKTYMSYMFSYSL